MKKRGDAKVELMKYQKEALEKAKGFNKCAFFHDMGLGKTFTGAEKMNMENCTNNLVLCQKSKNQDWIDHFKNHYDEFRVFDLSKKKELDAFIEAAKEQKERIVGVVSYDSAWRRKELGTLSDLCLILDESAMISNESAKRSKFVLKIGKKAKGVILLSGTPISGGYEKLYSQCTLLGFNISKADYWNRFIVFHNYSISRYASVKIVDDYKNIDELKTELAKHGAQFLKADEVLQLPEKNDIFEKCRQTSLYKRFLKSLCVTIEKDGKKQEVFADSIASKRYWLRILNSAYNPEKLEKLKTICESTSEKIIVFYCFNEELDMIKKELNVFKLFEVNGAKKEQDFFVKNSGQAILVVQYQAGAMGLNLQNDCRTIVYFSYTDRSDLFEQSKARISRIGQKRVCFYYHLVVADTIEEKIYEALKQKKDYSDYLFKKDFGSFLEQSADQQKGGEVA